MARKHSRSKSTRQRPQADDREWHDDKDNFIDTEDIGLDNVDSYHQERDQIKLGSESEMSDNPFDDQEEVFGLGDSEDDDDDEEVMQQVLKKVPGLRRHVREIDQDDESGNESSGEDGWGSRRNMYYEDDDVSDDEDAALEEEEEALRLQRERAQDMDEADFFDDSLGSNLKSGKKSLLEKDDLGDRKAVQDINEELEKIDLKTGPVDAELIAQDFSKMSKQELMQRIETETPEMMDLLRDFKAKTSELQDRVIPMLEMLRSSEYATDKGVSLLELKNQLLLNYLLNISFYLYLRASGKPVRDHPVIGKLVELRLYLEKIKPLELKLQYQIDKLVKAATTGRASQDQDGLNFKPRLDQLIPQDASQEVADESDSNRDGVYRPPKIAPVRFDEEEGAEHRRRKASERARKHASSSRLMHDLIEEMTDMPEEINDAGNMLQTAVKKDRDWEERIRAEEDMMTRLPVSRQDKKKIKQQSKFANELADLDDFGDYTLMRGISTSDNAEEMRKKTLRSIIDKSVPGESGRLQKGGDDDIPYREKKVRFDTPGEDYNTHLDDPVEQESEDEYYKEVKSKNASRRETKESNFAGRFEPMYDEDEDQVNANGKRQINRAIEKNKGLTPKRAKENRNPRVKRRVKYEKSMIKLKSVKATMKDQKKPYAGEETGIKKNLARSVKF